MKRKNPKNSPQAQNKKSKTHFTQKTPLDLLTINAIMHMNTAIKTVKSKCPTQDMIDLQNGGWAIASNIGDAHITLNHAADVLSSARVALYQAYTNRNIYAQDFTIEEWFNHCTPADNDNARRKAYSAVHKEIHDNKAQKGAQTIMSKQTLPPNPVTVYNAKGDIIRIEDSEPVEVITRGYPFHVDYLTPETKIPERFESYTPQYTWEMEDAEMEAQEKLSTILERTQKTLVDLLKRGYTQKQAATILFPDIPYKTAYSRVTTAMAKIRKRIANSGLYDDYKHGIGEAIASYKTK